MRIRLKSIVMTVAAAMVGATFLAVQPAHATDTHVAIRPFSNSSLCLSRENSSYNPGTFVNLWSCNQISPFLHWQAPSVGQTGKITPMSQYGPANRSLSTSWASTAPGTEVNIWDSSVAPTWTRGTQVVNGQTYSYFRLSGSDNMCLAPSNGSAHQGNRLIIWNCDAASTDKLFSVGSTF